MTLSDNLHGLLVVDFSQRDERAARLIAPSATRRRLIACSDSLKNLATFDAQANRTASEFLPPEVYKPFLARRRKKSR